MRYLYILLSPILLYDKNDLRKAPGNGRGNYRATEEKRVRNKRRCWKIPYWCAQIWMLERTESRQRIPPKNLSNREENSNRANPGFPVINMDEWMPYTEHQTKEQLRNRTTADLQNEKRFLDRLAPFASIKDYNLRIAYVKISIELSRRQNIDPRQELQKIGFLEYSWVQGLLE